MALLLQVASSSTKWGNPSRKRILLVVKDSENIDVFSIGLRKKLLPVFGEVLAQKANNFTVSSVFIPVLDSRSLF
jgi:hypothetical protein